ncbi:unnamed protein product [Pieris macdunnoughi]|uniref:Uncharacterized protein n=1 Tax=Pieris macdunnoughi TaxID=345717 RepID=A0A821N359_9NEOP|nr:unnamed protein product [Pieris macdunnoughi]
MSFELSVEDKAFLAECEEEFKDRYTENDEEFMKVFNAEPSIPPIIENWYISNRSGGRFTPYSRDRYNRSRGYQGRRDEGSYNRGYRREYNDYEQYNKDRGHQGRRDEGSCNREYRRGYNDYEQGDNHNNRDRFQRRQ